MAAKPGGRRWKATLRDVDVDTCSGLPVETAYGADAADPIVNLMPALLDAVAAHATVGEIMNALADVFGRQREQPAI